VTDPVLFNRPWLTIRWDSGRHCIDAQWTAFANSDEFRSGTLRILDAIRDTRATSLVSDNRELEVVISEDQLWIQQTWTPLAVEAGLKRIAVIVARSGLGKYASEEIISQFPAGTFVTRTFESLDEALTWAAAEK
jgi:hypothetical protein